MQDRTDAIKCGRGWMPDRRDSRTGGKQGKWTAWGGRIEGRQGMQ